MGSVAKAVHHEPWNKGKIFGQKAPVKVKDIWALRVRLQMESRVRELALFNLGIDCKLRGCDLVSLKVRDICHGDQVASRAMVIQHETQRPVQFEITPATRDAVRKWIKLAALKSDDFLFPSRIHDLPHLGTRQYARILEGWVVELGLDPADYGTHSMRRTKATLIYRRTKNLRAVTVRYLGIEVDDALEISEQTFDRGPAGTAWPSKPAGRDLELPAMSRETRATRKAVDQPERGLRINRSALARREYGPICPDSSTVSAE